MSSSNTEGNKQAVVKIVVNSPTAAPVAEGNVAKAKEYMEQAQAVLGQVQAIQQQTQEIADDAAESANSAAESAGSAFAAAAPLWEEDKTYNPPDVIAGADGNTYRCIATNTGVDPTTDNGTNWKQITYNTNGIITLDDENNITPYADTTGTVVPNDLGGNLGTNNKRWGNIYGTKIIAQSMEINGQDIESLASGGRSILQRNTTYNQGDIVYSGYFPSWMYIECSQTGVTGDTRPDSLFPTTEIGSEIEDGTAKWITRHTHDGHVKGEVFPMSGASFNAEGFLIHPVLNIPMMDTHICDGTNDTPDLRGRFVIASDEQVNGTYKENATGGEYTHTLSWNEMPVHNHGASTNWTGEHTHDIQTHTLQHNAGTNQYYETYRMYMMSSNENDYNTRIISATIFEDDLWMTVAGGHNHSVTINNSGSGQAHNNMPPYYSLVYVKKIR